MNTRKYQSSPTGGWKLRVKKHPKKKLRKGFRSPYIDIGCGCCDEKVRIYYGDDFLEINGVNASIVEWQNVLMPLLLKKTTSIETFGTHQTI